MAPTLTIFGPNRSRRRDLFFERFLNERCRHHGIVVVVIVAVAVAVVAVVVAAVAVAVAVAIVVVVVVVIIFMITMIDQ